MTKDGFVEHHVAHHFDDAHQEFTSAKLGMWVFLAQEILFFGGVFVGYILLRSMYPEAFHLGSKMLDVKMGALNTLVLICSSFSMAMAVRAAQTSNKSALVRNLAITIVFACMFMVVKYFEYSHKFHIGTLPGDAFFYTGPEVTAAPDLAVFFGIYFTMTGLHGLHVLIGIGIIVWIMVLAQKGRFYADYFTPVEITGLYWHLVDLIWIYLFPLLYLLG